MIASLIIIIAAFTWLGIETKWLTIRLPYGKYTVSNILALPSGHTTPILLLDTYHPQPSNFTQLPMPETTTGKIKIVCIRG